MFDKMSDKNSGKFGVIGVLFLWAFEVQFLPFLRSKNAPNDDLTFIYF